MRLSDRTKILIRSVLPDPTFRLLHRWQWRVRHHARFVASPKYPKLDMAKYLDHYFPLLHLDHESLVIDIGSHEGWFSELCADRGATVIAFEPNPYTYLRGRHRLRRQSRIFAINAAVSSKSGLCHLYFPSEYRLAPELHAGSASVISSNKIVDSSHGLTVLTISLAQVLESVENVRLMKIDIEGAEEDLWPTLCEFADKIEFLALETHSHLTGREEWLHAARQFIYDKKLGDRWRLDWP